MLLEHKYHKYSRLLNFFYYFEGKGTFFSCFYAYSSLGYVFPTDNIFLAPARARYKSGRKLLRHLYTFCWYILLITLMKLDLPAGLGKGVRIRKKGFKTKSHLFRRCYGQTVVYRLATQFENTSTPENPEIMNETLNMFVVRNKKCISNMMCSQFNKLVLLQNFVNSTLEIGYAMQNLKM